MPLPVDPQLTNALFMVTFLAFSGAFKAIYAGWTVRETMALSTLIATQRRRITFVALGQLICTACAVWLLSLGSVGDIVAGVQEWLTVGLMGWIVAFGTLLVAVSPAISVLALASIHSHPSNMAHKRFGANKFCLTESHRRDKCQFFRATTTVDEETRTVRRVFVPVASPGYHTPMPAHS